MSVAAGHERTQDDFAIDTAAVAASLAIHVFLGVLLAVLWIGRGATGSSVSAPSETPEPWKTPEEDRDELRLGLENSRVASINWLGIDAPEPVEGVAPEAPVEQAAQTRVRGQQATPSAPAPEPSEPQTSESQPPQPQPPESQPPQAQPPQPDATEQTPPETPEPAEAESRGDERPETQPEPAARSASTTDGAPESSPEPVEAERAPGEVIVPEPAPDDTADKPDADAGPPEPAPDPDPDPEPTPDPDPAPEPADEPSEDARPASSARDPQPERAEPTTLGAEAREPLSGLDGIVTDREVVATAIERAIPADPQRRNAPVAGEGLEITTVMPRWSSTARMTGAPANPIVVLHFGADGSVKYADFLREKRRAYSSGSEWLDEPLISAMYRWRAEGERIDELDPEDPDDVVEVTIKVLFHSER